MVSVGVAFAVFMLVAPAPLQAAALYTTSAAGWLVARALVSTARLAWRGLLWQPADGAADKEPDAA
jgi:hypothetical protein